ncbi:MAG: gamma-glutamyltransferase [Hormoscilla sp. GM102CHS1]|nr:gamma-glutamyltransferase [Hormoscilla sp. GM102CHS1]
MLEENLTDCPYPGARRVMMGQRGAVATSQPLATLAGMEMLWAGGNAVDAAVAMAIALTVVEPTSNAIGSDAFALIWDGESSRSECFREKHSKSQSRTVSRSGNLSLEQFQGRDTVPETGWLSVSTPGAVSAWRSLWER